MGKVTFLSVVDASKVSTPTNVISIGSKGDWYDFACEHKRVLRIEFDDVEGFVGSSGYQVFSHIEATQIHNFVKVCGGEDILVHCYAGISRSAAVAKYISDKNGYVLDLSPPCAGTTDMYNRHVYGTLNLADAESLRNYYAELELADRLKGEPT